MNPQPPRPFRFGIQASGPCSGAEWSELARKVEGIGAATLTVADHLDNQFSPMPAIMAAAAATETLRVGALVLCNDFRHPVMAAKEAATIDVLSDGRFEFGLGAGWMSTDYEMSGIEEASPGVRIERLTEAIKISKGLFSGEPVQHAGHHYTVNGLTGAPVPVQAGGPPLLIGGGGPRILALAGREADIVGINPNLRSGVIGADAGSTATAAHTDDKIGWIRDAAGDRFDQIELQVRIHLAMVSTDRPGVAAAMAGALGLEPSDAMETPHALVGTVDEICDQLIERRDRWGISYIGLSVSALDELAPVIERLAGA